MMSAKALANSNFIRPIADHLQVAKGWALGHESSRQSMATQNQIVECDDHARLHIQGPAGHDNAVALIDRKDIPRVQRVQWLLTDRVLHKPPFPGRPVALKTLLMSPGKGRFVATLNGEELDLRRSNLVVVTADELVKLVRIQSRAMIGYDITPFCGTFAATVDFNETCFNCGEHRSVMSAKAAALAMASKRLRTALTCRDAMAPSQSCFVEKTAIDALPVLAQCGQVNRSCRKISSACI